MQALVCIQGAAQVWLSRAAIVRRRVKGRIRQSRGHRGHGMEAADIEACILEISTVWEAVILPFWRSHVCLVLAFFILNHNGWCYAGGSYNRLSLKVFKVKWCENEHFYYFYEKNDVNKKHVSCLRSLGCGLHF